VRRIFTRAITLLIGLGTSACLSNSHVIPRQDLQALAQTAPEARGQRVRVIQGFQTEDDPPDARRADASGHVSIGIVTPVHHVGSGPAPAPAPSASSAADHAAFWILVAAGVAVGMAATEGARYDGWVELHPMHPVHLYGWDGSYTWMPLAHITPETAAWTRKAIIRESEGQWRNLGRAPLNRRGWTYSMLVGTAETPISQGANARGFTSHIQFGRFVSQEMGVLFDLSMGWSESELGDVIYDSRSAVELQYLPLSAGRLHAGGFGQIGTGYRLDDNVDGRDKRGFLFGGGAMLQLELTTRLTLTARAGVTMVYGQPTSDLTAGVSIY
jgi:hypothetical protein